MVLRFIDFYEEPQTYFLVLEKVPGGELFDRIISEGRFCEKDAVGCIRSLLEALAYCHSRKIAHRDIKPENILFASLDAKDRTIKVTVAVQQRLQWSVVAFLQLLYRSISVSLRSVGLSLARYFEVQC